MKPKNKLENDIAKAIERHHAWKRKVLKIRIGIFIFLIAGLGFILK